MLTAVMALALLAFEPMSVRAGVPVVEGNAMRPSELLAPRLLRTLAMDALGRPPLESERAEWSTKSRAELVDALLATRAFWDHWKEEQLYYFLLLNNFRPKSDRVAAISAELAEGQLEVRAATHRIALSSSFDQRNPGADTFVTVVMEQLCGLEVKKNARELEIGKKVYDGADGTFLGASGKTQADLVRIAIQSPQFTRHFLAREYARYVHAKPDPKELATWAARFDADPKSFRGIVRDWLLSPAYDARVARGAPQENRLFVRALYVDLVGRAPTDEEAEPLREALDGLADPTPLRGVFARLLIDSDKVKLPKREELADAGAWIDGLFARLLGRAPSTEERATFVGSLAEPGCRTQTVVYAIVSGAEYARY
ncbi:MAG: hypothetical protein IPJ77_04775 [Planctomycetes bacterium]|nr:hypothetical protein [Planctomycetota bacterium]